MSAATDITNALQNLQSELSSMRYMFETEIRRQKDQEYYKTTPPTPEPQANYAHSMRLIAKSILRKYSGYSSPDIEDVLAVYLTGGIGRYGITQCLTHMQLDNLKIVELIEEADKYIGK